MDIDIENNKSMSDAISNSRLKTENTINIINKKNQLDNGQID